MMTKELARELAERLAILADDFEMVPQPVGETIYYMHQIEKDLLYGNIDGILDGLMEEIEEYDGDKASQEHADQAKELLAIIKEETE